MRSAPLLLATFTVAVFLSGPALARQVVISEVMSSSGGILLDEDGDASDWIELYNPTGDPIDVSGWGLSDADSVRFKWVIPELTLSPGDHSVIFSSGKDRPGLFGRWETLLEEESLWRYLVPSAEPAAEWISPGFDDSDWAEGPSGFGYGDRDDATVVPSTLSVFVRRTFEIEDPSLVSGAYLHMDYDDGFVAYINGVEVARANMGTASDRPPFDHHAETDHEARNALGLPPESFSVSGAAELFVPGLNTIAIQVHNQSIFSADLSLIPYLSVGFRQEQLDLTGLHPLLEGLLSHNLHTNFRLSAKETVCLTSVTDSVSDCMTLFDTPDGVSTGRVGTTGEVAMLSPPTPGAPNGVEGFFGVARAPQFSAPSGRYRGPLELTIESDQAGARIAYSVDGSDPLSAASGPVVRLRFTSPIVVKARVGGTGLLPGPIVTRTFLVNAPDDLPAVSLVVDPDSLFDPVVGMLMFGPNANSSFPHFGANFWEDRELRVHVEWIDPDGSIAIDHDAGMAVFGGWSRGSAQKSVALHARRIYGASAFQAALFPERASDSFEAIVLRNSGNDWNHSMLRDGFMQSLVRDTEIDVQSFRPTVVYINGDYWGIMNAREKVNEHFVAMVGQVEPDNIDMIEHGDQPFAIRGDFTAYDQLVSFLETAGVLTDAKLATVSTLMDLDNFTDYQAAQIYFDNRDWPGNNSKAWRERSPAGPFRWILYDTDFGYSIWDAFAYNYNTLRFALDTDGPPWPNPPWSTFMLRKLLENRSYRDGFINRFSDLLNVQFDPNRALNTLDSLSGKIEEEIPRHGARWGMSEAGWRSDLRRMEEFATRRPEIVRGHIRSYFSLGPTSPVRISNPHPERGYVRVNRADIREASWSGLYFDGIEVPVTAVPFPGYRFSGWSGASTSTSPGISVDPRPNPALTATFEADAGGSSGVVIAEIMYHSPDDLDSGDWVELANAGPSGLFLDGFALSESDTTASFQIPPGIFLNPNDRFILAQDSIRFAAVHPGVARYAAGWPFGLSASGDEVVLHDGSGTEVDRVEYDDKSPWPEAADGEGASLELVNVLMDNSSPESWRASPRRGGTPLASYAVDAAAESAELPSETRLAAYPNPFSGSITLEIGLSQAAVVQIEAFDLLGRRVARRDLGTVPAGLLRETWQIKGLAPGPLFLRLLSDGRAAASLLVIHGP